MVEPITRNVRDAVGDVSEIGLSWREWGNAVMIGQCR